MHQLSHQLYFASLSHPGRALSFPCDRNGEVELGRLGECARDNDFLARSVVGCDYRVPRVAALEDKQFSMMEAAFLRTGGLVLDNAVAHQLRRHAGQPVSVLAHWIVRRRIVCFPWKSQTLVPLFQFNAEEMTLRPGVSEILGELVDVFDDWEIAHWFATPNSWLDDASPVDAIAQDCAAVQDAARADRFIAYG